MNRKTAIEHIAFICLLAILIAIIVLRANTDPFASAVPLESETAETSMPETTELPDSVVKAAETEAPETPAATAAPAEPEEPEEPAPPAEAVYTLYFDELDAQAVAQMLWGEARGCALDDKQNCVRTVCNRVDDCRFPDSIIGVVSQYYQYLGYSPYNPVDPDLYEIAVEILTDWSLSKQGVNCEWYSFNSFWGDGVRNHFYTV